MMTNLFNYLNYYLNEIWNFEGSQFTSQLPFFKTGPWLVLSIIGCYLVFVKSIGPKLMKNRKPFELRKVMLIYNLLIVVVSSWLFICGFIRVNFGLDFWKCDPNITDSEIKSVHLTLCWCFFLTKLVELTDTVFFVLRKKDRQISTLHVFHHSTVPISAWICIKFIPRVTYCFFPWINCGVHSLMYSYYALTAIAPQLNIQSWKKYLTIIQITQFILALVHSVYLFINPNCQFYKTAAFILISNSIIFLALFWSFYQKNYSGYNLKSDDLHNSNNLNFDYFSNGKISKKE